MPTTHPDDLALEHRRNTERARAADIIATAIAAESAGDTEQADMLRQEASVAIRRADDFDTQLRAAQQRRRALLATAVARHHDLNVSPPTPTR
jgi:hypothetical protein